MFCDFDDFESKNVGANKIGGLPVQPMPIPTQTPPGMTSFSQAGTQVIEEAAAEKLNMKYLEFAF